MISKNSAVVIRRQLGMTQKELADAIEASQVTVSRYETGAVPCSYKYLKRISEATGRSIYIRVMGGRSSEAYIDDE